MRALQEWQRMFADPEIPVWMANPDYIELFLKAKWKFQIRSSQQLIKNHAIIDAFNPDLVSCALVEQLPPTFCNIGERNGRNSEKRLSAGEVYPGFLFRGFDLEQNDIFRSGVAENGSAQKFEIVVILDSAEG